jgi:hypothetical protein
MKNSRLAAAWVATLLVALAIAPAAGAKTTAVKLKGGTTTLAFNGQSAANLQAMGIAVAPVAPTTAVAGPVLTFPIRSGTLKIAGAKKKKVTGHVTQTGGMTLSKPTYVVAMNTPSVTLGGATGSNMAARILLNGASAGVMAVADVDLSKAKVTLTSKKVKLTGVVVKLNPTAAGVLNQVFQVTGFTPGFVIGTATLRADLKSH